MTNRTCRLGGGMRKGGRRRSIWRGEEKGRFAEGRVAVGVLAVLGSAETAVLLDLEAVAGERGGVRGSRSSSCSSASLLFRSPFTCCSLARPPTADRLCGASQPSFAPYQELQHGGGGCRDEDVERSAVVIKVFSGKGDRWRDARGYGQSGAASPILSQALHRREKLISSFAPLDDNTPATDGPNCCSRLSRVQYSGWSSLLL